MFASPLAILHVATVAVALSPARLFVHERAPRYHHFAAGDGKTNIPASVFTNDMTKKSYRPIELRRGQRLLLSTNDSEISSNPLEEGNAERESLTKKDDNCDEDDVSSYSFESSGSSSKGVVSSLTGFVNFFMDSKAEKPDRKISDVDASQDRRKEEEINIVSPSTPKELMERIRDDYTVRNYLWTGAIDLSAFEENCRFTDPTLSFEGTDTFVSNVENLVPIVDKLVGTGPNEGSRRSELLEIECNEDQGYVQTRWNMVGELNALPWKPKIDVIGRTKFWYRDSSNGSSVQDKDSCGPIRVRFYDEEWELPAGKALLQLITPAGTIPNSTL